MQWLKSLSKTPASIVVLERTGVGNDERCADVAADAWLGEFLEDRVSASTVVVLNQTLHETPVQFSRRVVRRISTGLARWTIAEVRYHLAADTSNERLASRCLIARACARALTTSGDKHRARLSFLASPTDRNRLELFALTEALMVQRQDERVAIQIKFHTEPVQRRRSPGKAQIVSCPKSTVELGHRSVG